MAGHSRGLKNGRRGEHCIAEQPRVGNLRAVAELQGNIRHGAAPQGMHYPQHRLHAAVLVATGHRPVRLDATVDRELAGIDLRVTVQQNIPQEPESASTDMFNLKKLHDRVLLLCRAWTKMIAITGPK